MEPPESDSPSPYEAPDAPPPMPHPPEPRGAVEGLTAPAIILIVLATLSILLTVLVIIKGLIVGDTSRGVTDPAFHVGQTVGRIFPIISSGIVLLGSIAMLKLTSYRNAMMAAIISVIPLCSPLYIFGIPFGIWALVLLMKPAVKSAFNG